MMKKITILIMTAMLLVLAGCTDYRQVPPASIAKVLGSSGYEKKVLGPGRHDIGHSLRYRKDIVILDLGLNTYTENMSFILADKQTLKFDVKFKTKVNTQDKSTLEGMFDAIDPGPDLRIDLQELYYKFGSDIVRRVAREVVGKYTVEEVQEEYVSINKELHTHMTKAFNGNPLMPILTSMGGIEFPETYTKAVNAEKKAFLDIAINQNKEKAKRSKLLEEQETVKVERIVRVAKAKTLRLENIEIAKGLNPLLLEYQRLELQEKQLEINLVLAQAAAEGNNKIIYVPYGIDKDPTVSQGKIRHQ